MVTHIRKHLEATQDRQKNWADIHRRPLELEVGDHVFLKISLTRGVIIFGSRGKLRPTFSMPFNIVERVGRVAYRLSLPPTLSGVHDVFHVSQLQRYIRDDNHIINYSELSLRPDMSYELQPISIIDRQEKMLMNKVIRLVRVAWNPLSLGELTWELEEEIREKYPQLFG